MPGPSNGALALKMSELVDAWDVYTSQLRDWLGGTVTGGPYGDGRYPLTNSLGVTFYVPCPAAEAARVDAVVDSAEAFAGFAEVHASTAQSAAFGAGTARDIALGYRDAAQAARDLALLYRDDAANSASQALVYRNNAQTAATSAAADAAGLAAAVAAADADRVAAEAARVAAEAAAAAAATFNPANFYTKAEADVRYTLDGHAHVIGDVTDLQAALDAKLATASFTWTGLSGKPTTFAPSVHTHVISEVMGLQAALDAKLASASFTWTNLSGKPSTFAPSAHTHVIADVTGLQTALDGKQASLGYTPANKAGDLFTAPMYFDAAAEIVKFTNNNAWSYQMWNAAGSAARGGLFADSGAIRLVTANFAAGVQLTDAGAVNITGSTSMGGACTVNGVLKTSSGFISSEGAAAAYQLFERDALTVSWVLYATASKFRFYTGNGGFDLVDIEQPTGHIRMLRSGSEFSRANANSATLTRQPRVFVQSGDPGAAAADGDLWVW